MILCCDVAKSPEAGISVFPLTKGPQALRLCFSSLLLEVTLLIVCFFCNSCSFTFLMSVFDLLWACRTDNQVG